MPYTRMVAKLKSMAGVTALVGTRIYPMKVPQGAVLPFITYRRISRTPVNWVRGTSTTNFLRIQVNCWAANYDGALALAAAVRGDEDPDAPTGLSGWNDGVSEVWHLETEIDDAENITPGRDEFEAIRVIQDYIV